MKNILKKITLLSLISIMSMNISCIGNFKLFNSVVKWNKRATNDKFINEIIFLIISPVYGTLLFLDVFILNAIEFWTGKNPLAMNNGEVIERTIFHNNVEFYVKATKNNVEITPKNGKKITLNFNDKENVWYANTGEENIKLDEIRMNEIYRLSNK